tara:strand:+ start:5306 stop:5770 length:465 start_codon:yes stop_codon:yes gene_type:complete
MLWTDICNNCGHKEDDLRTVENKYEQPIEDDGSPRKCERCGESDWDVQKLYVPLRCWGLKGENENFPLRSHLKDNNGDRLVFNNLNQYESYLDRKGLAIAGDTPIGLPPEPKAVPSRDLESLPAFRKMRDMEKEGKLEPMYLPREEVENVDRDD